MPVTYRLETQHVQLDYNSLNVVRQLNELVDDDLTDAHDGVLGKYDIYIRRVRWYDLRHWLTHPNREVRMPILVGIMLAAIQYFPEFVRTMRAFFSSYP